MEIDCILLFPSFDCAFITNMSLEKKQKTIIIILSKRTTNTETTEKTKNIDDEKGVRKTGEKEVRERLKTNLMCVYVQINARIQKRREAMMVSRRYNIDSFLSTRKG